MIKNINVNELQSEISAVLKDVQGGNVYQVMRYSEPVAIVLSYNDYLDLKGECKECIKDIRKIVNTTKYKKYKNTKGTNK